MSMARFSSPPLPDAWRGREAIRIIDPLGLSAAWIAPETGGVAVGTYFRKRPPDDWLIGWESPVWSSAGNTGDPGCQLLVHNPAFHRDVPASCCPRVWRYVSRDPTSVVVIGDFPSTTVVVTSSCQDGGVRLDVVSETHGRPAERPVAGICLELKDARLVMAQPAMSSALVGMGGAWSGNGLECVWSHNLTCTPRLLAPPNRLALDCRSNPSVSSSGGSRDSIVLTVSPAWNDSGSAF